MPLYLWTRVRGYPRTYLHQEINLSLKNILSAVLLTLPFILFTAVTLFAWTGVHESRFILRVRAKPEPCLHHIGKDPLVNERRSRT